MSKNKADDATLQEIPNLVIEFQINDKNIKEL